MVAVNRIGTEDPLTFYGSSFISDPYGRKLVQAPRDEPAVLVADLDLDQRRDWLGALPLPDHAPPRRLRLAGRALTAQAVGWCSRAAAGMRSPRCASVSSASTARGRELRARARPGLGQRGVERHRRRCRSDRRPSRPRRRRARAARRPRARRRPPARPGSRSRPGARGGRRSRRSAPRRARRRRSARPSTECSRTIANSSSSSGPVLEQDRVGHADLADVVQQRGVAQQRDAARAPSRARPPGARSAPRRARSAPGWRGPWRRWPAPARAGPTSAWERSSSRVRWRWSSSRTTVGVVEPAQVAPVLLGPEQRGVGAPQHLVVGARGLEVAEPDRDRGAQPVAQRRLGDGAPRAVGDAAAPGGDRSRRRSRRTRRRPCARGRPPRARRRAAASRSRRAPRRPPPGRRGRRARGSRRRRRARRSAGGRGAGRARPPRPGARGRRGGWAGR